MGNIYHEWNGTVLTVTSDSGTSSCDLKGAKGDMGVRGAQGAKGDAYFTYEDLTPEQKEELISEVDRDYISSNFSNVLRSTVALGNNGNITLTDVSPIKHKVKIKVSSKNLATVSQVTVPYTDVTVFKGEITGDFVLSFKNNLTGVSNKSITLFTYVLDGQIINCSSYTTSPVKLSGTLTEVIMRNWNAATGGSIDEIMLELGTEQSTHFTPYLPPTEEREIRILTTSDEDTSFYTAMSTEVEVDSCAPVMIIASDIEVALEATYNRDINKVVEQLAQAIISLGGNI